MSLWMPPLIYTAAIFAVSTLPLGRPPLIWRAQDKVVHLVEYAVLSALLFRAWRGGRGVAAAFLLAAAAAAALGCLDELYQSVIPSRTADPFDALADAVGAFIGGGGAAAAALILGGRRAAAAGGAGGSTIEGES